MTAPARVNIDGGSRGNPGPAAYAFTLVWGDRVYEEAEPLPRTTNNVAEYTALVRALEVTSGFGVRELQVFSDSELLVKQMAGEYRVKHADLQPLHAAATRLLGRFAKVDISHVRREQNKRADFLCNEAMDGRPRLRIPPGEEVPWLNLPSGFVVPPVETAKPPAATADDPLRDAAIAKLSDAAKSWAKGDATSPDPAAVWADLWRLLGEHKVLKKPKAK